MTLVRVKSTAISQIIEILNNSFGQEVDIAFGSQDKFLVWADGILQKYVCVNSHVHTSGGGGGELSLIKPAGGRPSRKDIGFGIRQGSDSNFPSSVTLEN